MGLRFRKSVNLGGFRINFSKSGVGYSFGGKGFRYTKTVRGTARTTISVPGTGFSWVEESGRRKKSANVSNSQKPTVTNANASFLYSVENSENAVSSDYKPFHSAINRFIKIYTVLLWLSIWLPFGLFIGVIMGISLGLPPSFASIYFLVPITIIATILYANLGKVKAVYDLDSDEGKFRIEHLQTIMQLLQKCKAIWQINDVYANNVIKTSAGARQSIVRTRIKIKKKKPYYLRANVKAYSIKLKKQILDILPNIIIIRGIKNIGAVAFNELHITVSAETFVETGSLPKDASIVDHTWQYVNKDGTPDRRYNQNRQIPVCLYGVIDIQSNSGFNTRLYLSNVYKTKELLEELKKVTLNSDKVNKQ